MEFIKGIQQSSFEVDRTTDHGDQDGDHRISHDAPLKDEQSLSLKRSGTCNSEFIPNFDLKFVQKNLRKSNLGSFAASKHKSLNDTRVKLKVTGS